MRGNSTFFSPNDPNEPPTLASLRRRAGRRTLPSDQPDLFSGLLSQPPTASPETPAEDLTPRNTLPATQPPGKIRVEDKPAARSATAPPLQTPDIQTPDIRAPHIRAPEREAEEPVEATEPRSHTWTVSGLVGHVRGLVERGYGYVTVEGEISNWRPAGSGHCYFTVKDDGAQLSAVLFRRQASLLRFRPRDGDAVKLHGQLSIYESRAQMQLIVEWMEQVGLGAVLAAVQRLKEKLRREGLFDRKRPLPPFPRCIGVVTSLQGAALRDIIKVCRRRHAAVQLLIYPAAVQGPHCAPEIAAGLRWFSAHPDRAEVVLVARGGGSWEDLHGFNDEGIARAIATCTLPVITGIGHATDSSIADAAADLCAPTPSAAAEMLTAAHHRVEERVLSLRSRLHRAGSYELLRAGQRLARLGAATVLRRIEDGVNRRAQRLDELSFRVEAASRARARRTEDRLSLVMAKLNSQNPLQRLREDHRRLELLRRRLERASTQHLATLARRAETAGHRLSALSPLSVLERGYALVYNSDGHLLRDVAEVEQGGEITARLAKGSLRARVC